jgi:hypothetical protein
MPNKLHLQLNASLFRPIKYCSIAVLLILKHFMSQNKKEMHTLCMTDLTENYLKMKPNWFTQQNEMFVSF